MWPRDWSSDVCSSDLTGVGLNAWVAVVFVLFGFAAPEVGVDALVGVLIEAIDGAAQDGRLDVKLGGELFDGEIGRASCRERVGVRVWGWSLSLLMLLG